MKPSEIDGYCSSRASRRLYQPFGLTLEVILSASQLIPTAMKNSTSASPTPSAAYSHASSVPTSGVAPTRLTVVTISEDPNRDATTHAQFFGGTTQGRDGRPKRAAPYVMTRHPIINTAHAFSRASPVIKTMACGSTGSNRPDRNGRTPSASAMNGSSTSTAPLTSGTRSGHR